MEEKMCSECRAIKPLSDFHKSRNRVDGLNYNCKTCTLARRKEYHQRRGWWVAKKYKERKRHTPEWWAEHKERQKINQKRYRLKNVLKKKARSAIFISLRAGTIIKPAVCEMCKKEAELWSHHWHGYLPPQWLDVIWLCHECHIMADNQIRLTRATQNSIFKK